MEKEKVLQEIGLTGNEVKIYLALLKGASLVKFIAKETKLNRTHIYDRLSNLIEKGIVSYSIQAGKKYFWAIPPERLLEKLKEKEEQFIEILPELVSLKSKEKELRIEIFNGRGGLKTLLQDILKDKKEVFILGFTGAVAKEVQYFYPHFQKERIKLRIKRKIIADAKMRNSLSLKEKLTTSRFIDPKYQNPSGMWIYGDKVVIFLPGEDICMVFVESKKLSKLYRNYFNILWGKLL